MVWNLAESEHGINAEHCMESRPRTKRCSLKADAMREKKRDSIQFAGQIDAIPSPAVLDKKSPFLTRIFGGADGN